MQHRIYCRAINAAHETYVWTRVRSPLTKTVDAHMVRQFHMETVNAHVVRQCSWSRQFARHHRLPRLALGRSGPD
jgi:hypothetical protein